MLINLFATYRTCAGVKEIALDLPAGVTIRQVIQEVVQRCPALRQKWLDEDGELYPHVHIFHHWRESAGLVTDLDTPLQPDAVLDFFPPVAGG